MDNIMNFEQILSFLTTNNWHQVDQTNEYLSKFDIFLKFTVEDWDVIPTKDDLPENIKPFRNQLVNKMIVNSFFKAKVAFSYKSQVLKTITLYKFTGHLENFPEALRETYFAKPENRTIHQSVDDDFHKAMIRYFNSDETMGFVRYSHPNI